MAERSDEKRGSGHGSLLEGLPTDRLIQELENLLAALGQRALSAVTEKASGGVKHLAHPGGDGDGLKEAVAEGGRQLVEHIPLKAVAGAGLSKVKDKAKEALPGGGGGDKDGGKKVKVVNIVEEIDVGVPVSVAYNQWTQFEDYPSFMKKVERVEQESETELDWKAQIFLSHREWHSTVIEQVPDERIVWRSKAEKGHVDGAVTFHEIAPNLTRILLVLQYHPQGLFEGTGNLFRAQGRRVRLELKHFRRQAMSQALLNPEEVRGWRGEVRDGEVVRTDEEVREEEEGEREEAEGEEPEEAEYVDEDEDYEAEDEGSPPEDEEEEEEEEEEEPEEEEEEEEPEEKPAPARRRSSRAKSR
ncbi:putative membrane protein [Streptomyces sp. SLBN-118]|uniref:SRPBCC family protein n=1 Tax=Streptomyces sp. SLBN-118 TaxID=2768454 RepID=UPI0011535741|nr:SRPBCC family protein [Streptomyces sp. SLBN-118]TQK42650.1 putative membrane protein [Streptomyces sp. SLBN-118]